MTLTKIKHSLKGILFIVPPLIKGVLYIIIVKLICFYLSDNEQTCETNVIPIMLACLHNNLKWKTWLNVTSVCASNVKHN